MLGWKVIPQIGIGPIQFSPHGVGIAFGCFVGAWLMARRCRARGIDENHAWNTAAWGVVGAIIGARFAYVIGHLNLYTSPVQWLEIWKGGISLIGGLLGGTLLAALYFRRHHLDFWEFADLGAPCLALGVALGRSGDLVIGDHLGKPTHFFLGWVYKGGRLISPPPCTTPKGVHVYPTPSGCIVPGIEVHQTALYDALWCLVIFAILMWIQRRPRQRGLLFLTWATLYACGRIVTDFLRVDKRWILGLTGSQISCIIAVLVCGFLILRYRGAPGSGKGRVQTSEAGTGKLLATPDEIAGPAAGTPEDDETALDKLGTVRVLTAEREPPATGERGTEGEPAPEGEPPAKGEAAEPPPWQAPKLGKAKPTSSFSPEPKRGAASPEKAAPPTLLEVLGEKQPPVVEAPSPVSEAPPAPASEPAASAGPIAAPEPSTSPEPTPPDPPQEVEGTEPPSPSA